MIRDNLSYRISLRGKSSTYPRGSRDTPPDSKGCLRRYKTAMVKDADGWKWPGRVCPWLRRFG